jgi:hypothetical protein
MRVYLTPFEIIPRLLTVPQEVSSNKKDLSFYAGVDIP